MTHDELVKAAAHWLRKTHPVVLEDVRTTCVNEQPDVIGWKNNASFSFVLECKVSLEDFRRDDVKGFRRYPERGMGRLRAYVMPEVLAQKVAAELREKQPLATDGGSNAGRWGVYAMIGRKTPNLLLKPIPFQEYAVHEEMRLLVSAVRRVTEGWGRRMFGPDAPLNPHGDPHPTASRTIQDLMKENRNLRRRLERHNIDPYAPEE